MNEAVFLLLLLNLVFIGLLPKIFFRKDGRFNAMWWLTASPFFLCVGFLTAAFAGYVPPLAGWNKARALIAVCLSVASIALIFFTLGTHRIPIALWHQANDAPKQIVTYGAYGRIRHPFYVSFILALLSALVFCPHWVTLFTLVHGFTILNLTAAREEKRLCASEFGSDYEDYMRRTGRFFPRLSARLNQLSVK
ncbi:MAG: isoprenylcysteine carboxylmethyltransferase family protein [Blastocatellia bacterium]